MSRALKEASRLRIAGLDNATEGQEKSLVSKLQGPVSPIRRMKHTKSNSSSRTKCTTRSSAQENTHSSHTVGEVSPFS